MSAETRPPAASQRSRPLSFLLPLLCAAGGIYVGMRWHTTFERWLVPSGAMTSEGSGERANTGDGKKQLWTCGMHPQVIQDHPGDCPICHMKLTPLVTADDGGPSSNASVVETPGQPGLERKIKYWWDPMMNPPYISDKPGTSPMGMDLVPVYEDQSQPAGATVVIDPAVVQNMGVRTAVVTEGPLQQRVRATAAITEPEPGRRDINLRVSGWIQTLYANTDGMEVKKGDPLFDLYSPELRVAIEELISARKAGANVGEEPSGSLRDTSVGLVSAAELRLTTLGLTPEQVTELGAMEHAPSVVTFVSPMDGHVIEKAGVYNGSAVSAGMMVLRLADRSSMWFEARIPEGQIARVQVGQQVVARVDAVPGRTFEGEVVFIHPHLDEMTRTAMVRMTIPNPGEVLRQGMYATVDIDTSSDAPAVLVPREAIIDSGESQIVFVSTGKGRFEPRRVVVGQAGEQGLVQVLSGLEPGEAVVSSGQFLLDSESRLREAIAKFLGQRTAGTGAPESTGPTSGVTTVPTSQEAQTRLDGVVTSYLALAETLGAIQKDETPLKPDDLIGELKALNDEAKGTGLARIVAAAVSAAEALKGQAIDKQRELFKAVSAKVIAVVDDMPPSPVVAGSLYVVNCPMAKADWLQRTKEIANPYYAEEMKECGSVVRTLGGAKGVR